MKKKLTLIIMGRVQGVFYRASAKETADTLNIKGYAKNQADGTVKIEAEGESENLNVLMDWCRKGSQISRVEKIKETWAEYKNEFKEFKIL